MVSKSISSTITTALVDKIVERIRLNYDLFEGQFPSYGDGDLSYNLTPNQNWLASFWSGLQWLTYSYTGEEEDLQHAQSLLPSFEARLDNHIRLNHDIGFLFTLSARAKYLLTRDEKTVALALRAADVLRKRYRPVGEYIQAWGSIDDRDEAGRLIIDCMMNLPLLFWAHQLTGDEKYYEVAYAHACTSQRLLVREDYSTYHTYFIDPETGHPSHAKTHQGYADDSLWARGQAWAIYGFTMVAEWTGDTSFIETAKQTAQRYFSEAPLTEIATWDLRLPDSETPYPDSSADAIAASGLLRLATITGKDYYTEQASNLLHMLTELAFDSRDDAQGILLHGTQHKPHNYGVDTYTIFGDYFYLEAVMRLLNIAPDFWGPDSLQKEKTMTYFTSLSTDNGINLLDTNPCNLLDFQLVILEDGQSISGNTADREVLAVILGGKANFTVGKQSYENLGSRPHVFSGKPTSVYMPYGNDYTITGSGHAEIALCSAPSDLDTEPYVIVPDQVVAGRWGAANFSRNFHQILTKDGQPDLPARRLIVGETFTPSGNWSTYPAHKHEADEGGEAFHEEMYFFKVSPANGFGIARHYGEGYEDNHTVRDNTILMIPHGYHTYAGAPGYSSYYLWFLAGDHRNQGVTADPDTGWVNQTVPMLRSLGH